ncbi:MAG: thermonuclease family protein [Candidatus Omnitrophota bacterium]
MSNRRIYTFLALVILILSSLSCNLVTNYDKVKVAKVIDGDTIELENGQCVRYIGIDTPETRKLVGDSWVPVSDYFGGAASEFNRKLVEGKFVRLEFDVQKKDKYNRILAYCFVDNDFVNAKLIKEGYALLYTYPPNLKYVGLFVKLLKEARQNNRGLWAADEIIAVKDAHKFIGKIRTVEGKILSVKETRKTVLLNFGRGQNSIFKAVIFKDNLSAFIQEGFIPSKYKNKNVRIFGLLKEYNNSPEIIIQDPSQIEIVE